MSKLLLLTIGLVIFSCNQTDRESLRDYIEFKVDSENYIRWTKDQNLNWALFNGKPNSDAPYDCYFGTYFYWDFDEHNEFRFNATVYFDRTKSWVREKSEWGEGKIYFNEIPQMLELKFDYHEYVTRQFRKELAETGKGKSDKELRELSLNYFNRAEKEWNEIQAKLFTNFSVTEMSNARQMIDDKLNQFKDFNESLNSVFR